CFFFQAEDGIRGFHVTGVQTCALPISDFGCAPIRMSAISPSLNIINVGIDRIPKRAAISGFSSILSLAIVTLPDNSAEISSSAGAIILHGPHHSAQKSTTTGSEACRTWVSKLELSTLMVAMIHILQLMLHRTFGTIPPPVQVGSCQR